MARECSQLYAWKNFPSCHRQLARKLEALQYNIEKESPESNYGKTFCGVCKNGYKVSSGLYTQYACLLNVPCEKFEIKR